MALYDPFIERDVDGIRKAVRDFRDAHSSEELFLAVARFAVLAYSPSQHGKRSLLCCLAAHDLREQLGERFDDLVTECGIYAAMARQPWSEPPILDPPDVDSAAGSDEELRAAVAGDDRLRGERWLAARLDDPHLAGSYFAQAAASLDDGGDALVIALAAWRLTSLLGEKGRFATLRLGVWEKIAARGTPYRERGRAIDAPPLLERMIDDAVAARGAPIAMQPLFLFDSANAAAEVAGEWVIDRVRDHLTAELESEARSSAPAPGAKGPAADLQVYPLGRDYGSCLVSHAAAARFEEQFPAIDVAPMLAAVHENLEKGESFEEWS